MSVINLFFLVRSVPGQVVTTGLRGMDGRRDRSCNGTRRDTKTIIVRPTEVYSRGSLRSDESIRGRSLESLCFRSKRVSGPFLGFGTKISPNIGVRTFSRNSVSLYE